MKKTVFFICLHFISASTFSQAAVGIGTTNPNSKSILDLSSTTRVFLPPRMTTAQMEAITTPPYGGFLYNSTLHSHMTYARMGSKPNPDLLKGFLPNNLWLPVTPGPKVLAWGVVDSSGGVNENSAEGVVAPVKNGSGNFVIRWYGTTNNKKWYELNLHNDQIRRDSMMLMVTPVGNGSWDVAVSIGEITTGTDVNATIKFVDISRSVSGFGEIERRRRSNFYFVLYDLRGY